MLGTPTYPRQLGADWCNWREDDNSRSVEEGSSVVGIVGSEPEPRRRSYVEEMGGWTSKLFGPK